MGINAPLTYVDLPTDTFIIDWSTNQIADSNFLSVLQDLIGDELDYIRSELPRRIEDAFSVDSRILSVDNYVFNADGRGNLTVRFDVQTAYGTISEEVTVNNDRFERIHN